MNTLVVTLEFGRKRDGQEAIKVVIDANQGPSVSVSGTLFPSEITVISGVVEILKSQRSRYVPVKESDQ